MPGESEACLSSGRGQLHLAEGEELVTQAVNRTVPESLGLQVCILESRLKGV